MNKWITTSLVMTGLQAAKWIIAYPDGPELVVTYDSAKQSFKFVT